MKNDVNTVEPFWQTKKLTEMNEAEWESLCDGCAQCCQLKFKVADSPKYVMTPVVCKLLDLETCRCASYDERHRLVPDCVEISPHNISDLYWLPETCAYRLLAEGKTLYDWHPLIAGDSVKMRKLGISVAHRTISERDIHPDDLATQVLRWVENCDEKPLQPDDVL